jgi:hypothetical protein
MIMSINRFIINRKMKLMEMGGREEILLERISTTLIMQGILPEVIDTSLINPSLKGATICRRRIIFICTQRLIACRGLRGNERSEEYCMVSWRRG